MLSTHCRRSGGVRCSSVHRSLGWMLVAVAAPSFAQPADSVGLRSDAASMEQLVNSNYAYLERLPGGRYVIPPKLKQEGGRIGSMRDLVTYSERALALLADHHAITGSSTAQSWALFPSFGDLWVEVTGTDYVIEQVRQGSPAEQAGIRPGDHLKAVQGVATGAAVSAFWGDLGAAGGGERDGYAARVLAAGRRDGERTLTFQRSPQPPRTLTLPNLYQLAPPDRPVLSAAEDSGGLLIRFHDSLGSDATIAAFDAAMMRARPDQRVVLDLTDTPSGGNTTVARAILGWFVSRPAFYQVHSLPAEERRTGVARQWVEQVLPRPGKHHRGPVVVRVSRWTGSMGEGLAVGFAAIGARVEGTRMARLLGAVYDYRLPASGLMIKLPTERLHTVAGVPREKFEPSEASSRPSLLSTQSRE